MPLVTVFHWVDLPDEVVEELRKKIHDGVPLVDKEDEKGPTPPLYMPSWKDKIKGQELEALLDYLFSIGEKEKSEW